MKLYVGVVEDNNDPDQVGKVKIRIPHFHGDGSTGKFIGTEALNWFEPCIPFYGGYQSGSFIVPPVGAIVWCAVEEVSSGVPYRIYLGGMYGTGASVDKEFGDDIAPEGELETPEEAIEAYPNVAILFKSLFGSYIRFTEDGDIGIKFDISKMKVYEDHITLRVGDEEDEEDESLIEIYEDYIIIEVGESKIRLDKDDEISHITKELMKFKSEKYLEVDADEEVLIKSGESIIKITKDDKIEIETNKLVHIKKSEELLVDIGENIEITSGGTISIESGECITIGSSELVSISSSKEVELSGGTVVNISGGDEVVINTPSASISADEVTINSDSTTINGQVNLAGGGYPVARVGDKVVVDSITHVGTITEGSSEVFSG